MVAKLMKHELYALFRILLFLGVAVFVLAVAGRILLYFSIKASDFNPLQAFTGFVIFFYAMAIMALTWVAYILGIYRFNKTLFSGEGYMTLSLPVTATQLIWSKLLSALIGTLFAAAVSMLSLTVFLVGWDAEIMQEIFIVFSEIGEGIIWLIIEQPILFIEGLVLLFASLPTGLLTVFAIISTGQLFTKHRKLMTFLIFIGVYFVANSILSVFLELIIVFLAMVSPHVAIWLYIGIIAAIDAGCFFYIRFILKNKVNLLA